MRNQRLLAVLASGAVAAVSFLWVMVCWMKWRDIPEIFFYRATPFAIICAGALISWAILCKSFRKFGKK